MSRSLGRRLTVLAALALGISTARSAAAQEPTSDGLHYHTVPPCRLVDTRREVPPNPIVTDTIIPGGSSGQRLFQVKGRCGVSSSAKAVAVNLTVPPLGAEFNGHIVAYQSDIALPSTSNVNITPGAAEQNFAIVTLSPQVLDMKVYMALGDGAGSSLGGFAHLVVDVVGYFK